jgi:ABC-type multidrug transport system fused ATPase/permease subunit
MTRADGSVLMDGRRWLQQIGGPNALTIWSWILTLPVALAAGSIYPETPTLNRVLQWTAILLLAHAVFGIVMWVITVTVLPHRPRRSRPAVALIAFASLGLARALTLQWADDATGLQGSTFTSRLATNVIGGVLILSLIAVLVDDYRTNATITRRLREAQESLSDLREREARTLQAADLDVLAEVQSHLELVLKESDSGPEGIRQVSESIVRPVSHRLAADDVNEAGEVRVSTRSWRTTTADVLRAMQAPSPLVLALIVEALAFGPVAASWGIRVAIANLVLGLTLVYAGARTIRAYGPLPTSPMLRPISLAAYLIVLAMISTFIASNLITAFVAPFPSTFAPAASLILASGLGLSMWTAVTRNQVNRRDAMANAVDEEIAAVEKLHADVQRRRSAAADFLHGPIQGQLVASALKGESGEQALDAISQRFAEYGLEERIESSEEAINSLISAWNGVIDISLKSESSVWRLLDADPVRCKLVLDALSEAITNAVRHGDAGDITIELSLEQGRITMIVTSPGELTAGIGNGTGLARLRDRGAEVQLDPAERTVVLNVRV